MTCSKTVHVILYLDAHKILIHWYDCTCVLFTGSDIMSLTECAEDATIALYHNKDVKEQSVDFYCYHMAQGWPASAPLDF